MTRCTLGLAIALGALGCGDDGDASARGSGGGGGGGGGESAGGATSTGGGAPLGAYPRIASYLIETYVSPEAADVLSRVELGIVDAEAGALDPDTLAGVRERNPDGHLLAYVTSEEVQHELDPAERPLSAARLATMPPSHWLLEPGSLLAAPVDAETDRFPVVDPDAFTLDRPESDFYAWDEPTFLVVGGEHVRLVAIEGDELIVERGYRSDPAPHDEGAHVAAHVVFFAGTWMLPEDVLAFDVGLERYLDWSSRSPYTVANAFSPLIGFGEIEEGADELARTDYRAMRFGLGVALMGDGLHAFDNGVFGHYVSWWYDEYDGAGRGPGWLGAPRGEATWRENGVATRDFERGFVAVNTGTADATLEVPPGLVRIDGAQDPAHNDGSPVGGALVIAAENAYLLVRP